jgi:hypothetical protein
MKKIALLAAICAFGGASAYAQRCGRLQVMDVDSDRVYNPHDEIKYDEPHGIYSGQMSVDTLFFVCPIRSSISASEGRTRYETYEQGAILVYVRRATDRQWTRKTLTYDCEGHALKPGKMEWAFSNDNGLQVGSRDSICLLQ